jgi:hypothetical protein
MVTLQTIVRAPHPHKWTAIFDDGKRTNFGAQGYQDYTQHGDLKRRNLYRQRHKKDLETNDPRRAGYLSYYILWNKPTIAESIRDYKRKFNL